MLFRSVRRRCGDTSTSGAFTRSPLGSLADESARSETFGLPILNLVDQPGISVGGAAERDATVRSATQALVALFQATVPYVLSRCSRPQLTSFAQSVHRHPPQSFRRRRRWLRRLCLSSELPRRLAFRRLGLPPPSRRRRRSVLGSLKQISLTCDNSRIQSRARPGPLACRA